MTERISNNENTTTQQSTPTAGGHKPSRALRIVVMAFFVFVTIVFLTQKKESISWIEDYQAGIDLAKRQNKPVLLAFYKLHTRFSSDMRNNTYNHPDVKKYVEANFVPILIDVDKQPDITELYNVNYYPSHYIKQPDSEKIFGPRVGYDPPALFINELERLRKEMAGSDK